MTALLRLTPLGGVGNFGRNCLLVEDVPSGLALIVDCGVRFVADESPGFDVGLPDLERIGALGERLLGYVVTHGHEDHIGALPYAWRENPAPIWATPYTARLIGNRCERLGVRDVDVDVVQVSDVRRAGPFEIQWMAVSHSIPDASCVAITTAAGTVVHSGDFRVDDDPVLGPRTDLDALTALGDRGVLCLLADSTGALTPGKNPGERSVLPGLTSSLTGVDGFVVVALFASHAQRLALVAEACRATGRKLVLMGRGLIDAVQIARSVGLFNADDVLVDERALKHLPRERVCIAVTGTQGETQSALARLAAAHPSVPQLGPGDRVVLSARCIPGNEKRLVALTDALVERGIDVVDGRTAPHVSGHGYQDDLELLLLATRPRTFVALHGTARHLLGHGDLAARVGLREDRIVSLRDGHALAIHDDERLVHEPAARAHEPLARDGHVTWWPRDIVHTRKRMSESGVLVIVDGAVPTLHERGFSEPLDDELTRALIDEARVAFRAIGTPREPAAVRGLARLFWRARRSPPEIILVEAHVQREPARNIQEAPEPALEVIVDT